MRVINERHLKKVKKSENQFEFNFLRGIKWKQMDEKWS